MEFSMQFSRARMCALIVGGLVIIGTVYWLLYQYEGAMTWTRFWVYLGLEWVGLIVVLVLIEGAEEKAKGTAQRRPPGGSS